MATDPGAWTEFAAAMVAASSALAGLIFVALSINVDRIINLAGVAELALQGVVVLTVVLIASILVLTPGQPVGALALELCLLAIGYFTFLGYLLSRTLQLTTPEYRWKRIQMAVLNGVPGVLLLITGLTLAIASIGGLYWFVPTSVLGLAAGVANAWVLLIEIKR